MEKIKLSIEVAYQLINLMDVLYLDEYVGFKDTAIEYVQDIERFIYTIPTQKCTLSRNQKVGEFYSKYKRNKQTTWYIFFDKEDDFYLIKLITNNHTEIYSKLI